MDRTLDADRWERIETLFETALGLAEGERPAYLDEACGGDRELRAEVEQLLVADSDAEGYMEEPAGKVSRVLSKVAAMSPDPLAGTRIGRYRLFPHGPRDADIEKDLDGELLRTPAEEPGERFAAAAGLAETLRRRVAGRGPEKTGGWPGLPGGRIGSPRLAAVAAAVTILAISGLAVTTSRQSVRLEEARQTIERQRAESEALGRLLEEVSGAHDVTVEEALRQAAGSIAQTGRPESDAAVHQVAGVALRNAGLYDLAERRLRRALELRRGHDADPSGMADSLIELGTLLRLTGRYDEAEVRLRQAYELRRGDLGADPLETLRALSELGTTLRFLRRFAEAEDLLRQAVAGAQGLQTADRHPFLASTYNRLATVLVDQGNLEEASAAFWDGLVATRTAFGDDDPRVATRLQELGFVYRDLGDLDAAESIARQAVELRRRLFGEGHPEVAESLQLLEAVLRARESGAGRQGVE